MDLRLSAIGYRQPAVKGMSLGSTNIDLIKIWMVGIDYIVELNGNDRAWDF